MNESTKRLLSVSVACAAIGLAAVGCTTDNGGSSATESATTNSATTESATTESATTESATTESATTESATTESSAMSSAAASGAAQAKSTTIMTPNGEVTLSGAILDRYNMAGGAAGALGVPTGPVEDIGNGGKVVNFANGAIYSTADGPAYIVQGEILRVYTANMGPAGALGFPTSDEMVIPEGWQSTFQHGTIKWVTPGNGVYAEQVTVN